MENWVKWYEQPYADNNDKLNDFIEDVVHRVSWKLFENQDKVVHRINETDNGIPKMREGALDYIHSTARNELSWIVHYIVNRILVAYLKGNITPSEEVEWWFEDEFSEEDAKQFWAEIDDYIWNDYAEHLGEARTAELWEQWGKKPR